MTRAGLKPEKTNVMQKRESSFLHNTTIHLFCNEFPEKKFHFIQKEITHSAVIWEFYPMV